MTFSLNEIEALSKRAARGAGLSWGMAEEAAKGARWLASFDLPGADLLVDLFAQNDAIPRDQVTPSSLEGIWCAPAETLCPLASGAALNDCADRLAKGQAIKMQDVSHPMLLVPFAAWAAPVCDAPVTVTWQTVLVTTDGQNLWIEDPDDLLTQEASSNVICKLGDRPKDPALTSKLRGTINRDVWTKLDSFAQRTLAPATEASRLLGAGAGGSDND